MKNTVISFMIGILVLMAYIFYLYTQNFNQDSDKTATQGIFFKKTLYLKEYKRVSNGNDLWGKYHRYSRSDRQTEAITVYCNKYCSK